MAQLGPEMNTNVISNEQYLEHEVEIRILNYKCTDLYKKNQEVYEQLNRKINIIMTICGAILTTVIVPIVLHSLKLV